MKYIGFLISAIFLYLLFKDFKSITDLQFSNFFEKLNLFYFTIGIFFNLLAYLAHSIRWRYFFVNLSPKYQSLKIFLRVILCGHFFNTVLPSKAGEFIRPYYFSKLTGVKYFTALSTCFVERLFDGFAVVLMAIISTTVLFTTNFEYYHQSIFISAAFYILLSLSPIILIKNKDFVIKLTKILPPSINKHLIRIIDECIEGFKYILSSKRITKILSTTSLYWIFSAIGMFFLLKSCPIVFYLKTPIVAVLIISVMGLVLMLPSAPANIGVYNYTLILLFEQIHNSNGVIFDTSLGPNYEVISTLFIHLGAIIPDILFGGYAYLTMPSSLREKFSHQN